MAPKHGLKRATRPIDEKSLALFKDLPKRPAASEGLVRRLRHPVWTDNKAHLIQRYLFYFVLVTKHGAYIDGFAGPQKPDREDTWAARLVLQTEPRWLRHFYLFEADDEQVRRLRTLRASELKKDPKRCVEVIPGNFNQSVRSLLESEVIRQKEATFCLLDQRTFECEWRTLQLLAKYKKGDEHKIELFYFLAVGWLRRALAALKDDDVLQLWWGREDWAELRSMAPTAICDEFSERMKSELGYSSVKAWPIYERESGGAVMYYMIHATDHPDAPTLMARAYNRAVQPPEDLEQLKLEFQAERANRN